MQRKSTPMKQKYVTLTIVALTVVVLAVYLPIYNTVAADSRVARIVDHQSLTGQNADLSPAATVSVPSGGSDYLITLYATKTAGNTAGAVTVDYTDDAGIQQDSMAISGLSQKSFVVHAASSTTLSISTINTQTGGGQTYSLYTVIQEM